MAKPHFMRIDKELLQELKEIKEKGRKKSISDVIHELVHNKEVELTNKIKKYERRHYLR